ncbi:zinc finger protein 469 [Pyxicephalus adspersus]|uniref:zinc finger protein 469 n=1 Tax=Pyxicephalus adspersus TaxID=30357 RepID=UPI003B5B9C7D
MTGETKHVYAINAKTPSSKKNDTGLEQFSKNEAANDPSKISDNSESALPADKVSPLNGRERETSSQREAVIRPQQAGKIDFKSLQNRPKYSSDATWNNCKSSPLSPTGKSRGKDKNKRSGKGDRSQHQLYRLSINSSRSNPTIGIAYPQQKVTPPKKVEVSHGPVSGSYRFHVPSLPEREAELHQEDLNFSRSLPEPSPSLTSTNYTSQTAPATRTHNGLKLHSGNIHDKSNSNGQLHYLEFQPNGNKWHSSGTSGYTITNQKLCTYPESNKSDSHGFGPLSFQYPFQPLQEPNGNTFCNNGNSQDFVDVSLAASQVAHNSFSFQSSSREGPEDPQGNGSYNTVLPDSRTYGLPSQQPPFLHTQQGAQHPPTPPCYPGRNELSAEHNGAISSSGALTPSNSGAIEQTQSNFQEKQAVFNPSEFSLHNNSVSALINKRQQPTKDFVHSQRLLTPVDTLRRNIPQTSLNKVHFSNKPYNNVNTGSVPFDKNLSRIPQTWDTGSNSFPPLDQNSLSYSNASGNSIPYHNQPSDPRQALKNPRMPWQQGHLISPTTNQNHIELSRHNGNQKLPYSVGNSEWQNNTMMTKILPSYHAKKHIVVDGSSTQRSETSRQSYSSSNDMLYDSVKDTNSQISDSRTKSILYGMSKPIPQSRNNSNQSVALSGKTFVAESPCESPLPSPVTNHVNGSTCSSLSPMSSSPVNPSSEESQVPPTLTSSPYFHQTCHQTDKSFHPNDPLNSGSFLYHKAELTKSYAFLLDSSKDEQTFKNLQENQYQKIANEPNKGCLESFESEPPPPYSSHHFLANSLSSANLDQLDVLLTCKQCDQNFGNLSSFLEHRQYCNLNSTLQNEMKDSLIGGDIRKSAASQTIPDLSHHKGQMEFHSELESFQKDYLLDCDAKGESKEDPLKNSTFHNGTAHLLPMTACETLEMDDAKLDSLIIEALNGLEFQVDNPEIDSTFIDVFVDDDLTSTKATACSQSHKDKESTDTRKNEIAEEKHTHHTQVPYASEENRESFEKEASYNHGTSIKLRNVSKSPEVGTAHPYSVESKTTIKHFTPSSEDSNQQTRGEIKTFLTTQEKKEINLNKNNVDGNEDNEVLKSSKNVSITDNPKSRKTALKDVKKKKSHNGTWSKELIHKIVQQKNKLHKLHVKSNKNVQFSLVTERLFPPTKNHPFGEYDYISDSDEDVAANLLPSKMQPNGRLKYSFNRDLQGRSGRQKLKEPVWRMGEATRFPLQSKDTSARIRRRSSQSSNSSDQSTSMSSEAGSSPKSMERTDSENEHETALRCKTFNCRGQNTSLERNLIKPLYRELSDNQLNSTDFSKGTKRFGSAKFLLASSKMYSTKNAETHYQEKDKLQQSVDPTVHNSSKITEEHSFEEGGQTKLSTYQDTMETSTLSNDNYTSNLLLAINNVPQDVPTFHSENTDFQKKQLNTSPTIPEMLSTDGNLTCSDNNVQKISEELCFGHKDFALPICFNEDSTVNIVPQQNQKFGNEFQQFPEDKHDDLPGLYTNNIFAKTQIPADMDVEQIYANQSNGNNITSFEQKCSDIQSYPTDKDSSSFSFDSSSIFAELPMSDFDPAMYNHVTPPKDNYIDFNQPSKSTPFEHTFSQFLPEKSWDLMEESAPILTANITPFQGNDNQAAEKYAEHVPVTSEDLSRNITDYSASYINNVQSEDELEIKRLVTELENQLQTNKAHNEVASQTLVKHNITPALTGSSLPFPEMEVNPTENNKNNYLNDNHNSMSNVNTLVHPAKVDCNVHDSQLLVKDSTPENLKSPWDCSVQLDTFSSNTESQKQTRTLASFNSPEDSNQYQSTASDIRLTEEIRSLSQGSPSVISGVYLPNISNQMECQTFSDNEFLQEAMVTTETLLSKSPKIDISETRRQQNNNENPTDKLQKLDEQFDDPPELEHFQSISDTNSEFCPKDDSVPDLNMTVMSDQNKSINQPNLFDQEAKVSIPKAANDTEHYNDHEILSDKEALDKHGYKDNKESVLLDMPVLVKEESTIPEKSTATQEATENPLHQLQLFVARTAKNNEEEMLMPCFPVILAASVTPENKTEAERDASYILEGAETFSVENENNQKKTEIKDATDFSESGIQTTQNDVLNMLGHKDSIPAMAVEPIINKETFEDDHINHHDILPPDSRDTGNLLEEQVKVNENISFYGAKDGNRFSSFVMKSKKVDRSNHTNDKEKYVSDLLIIPKGLGIHETPCDRPDIGCLTPGHINTEIAQLSKDKNNQGLSKEIPSFACSKNQIIKDINMLHETEMFLVDNTNQEHSSILTKGNSHVTDKSSHFNLHPNIIDVQQNSNNEFEAQLQGLGLNTEQSLLHFDLLSVEPIKEHTAQQKLMYTSQKELNSNEKVAPLCSSNQLFLTVATNPSEHLPEKGQVGTTDMHLFLSEERSMTLSTEANQQQLAAKDTITVTPVVQDGLSPCFCSELVCQHFKHQEVQSVADIILECQSMATDDTYPPIYTGENNQNFSVIHTELFSESMQNSVAPLLCNPKERPPKNDWNKSQDIPNIDPTYENEDKSSTSMVCDLLNIATPEYLNFNCHQATENTAERSTTEKNNISETQNSVSNNSESEKKGTNDMHSVIDGVLRILEGDKSKEILQSIGITTKGSPNKEKKLSGLSLTCDICLVAFRSKPGLTRHKAVKHNSSLMSPKDATAEKTLATKNTMGEWKCKSEIQQNLQTDTKSKKRIPEFVNQSNSFQPDEESSNTKGEKIINGLPENTTCIENTCKKKLVKVKKRKAKAPNNICANSQVPPDDVLNILKTNILKAIGHSNNFNSTDDKKEGKEPSDKNLSMKQTDLKEVKLKMCASVCRDDDEKLVSDVLDMEMNRDALLQQQSWADNIKGHFEHIINDCENQPINSLLGNENNLLGGTEEQLNTPENSNIKNDVQSSNLPKETVPDLHSLFDDDNSFSQLFPRDDHFIRRKCTRVYGKKNKRTAPPFETDFRQEEKGEQCHSSQIHYTCDYKISSDSSLMNMKNSSGQTEHHTQFNQPSPLEEGIDVDTKILSFANQSKPENINEQSLTEKPPLEQDSDISIHANLFTPPGESVDLSTEISSEMRESEVEENLDCKTNDESGLPEFPTIDMKMLSAKFDMRELSFFSACGDDSDQCDSDATDITQKAERGKRDAKSKTDEKRQMKNRNSVKIKTKDKQYKCKVCFQWFLTLGELDFHKLTHNPSPPPTCYMCVQRKFSSREQLRDHLKDKHAKNKAGLWICGMCLKEISDVWMYNEHLREHATQFARKGQAQKSVMGIPGCFGEESMVRTFLSTFIYRTPTKSSKNIETDEKSPVTKKQEPKEHKEEDEMVIEKECGSSAHVVTPAPKLSINPSLDSSQKSDTLHKNASMHPHCKDPSRDCHHCGKQFPKPFKLQRHLVVHSLQKIFLCHRCPKSYQEVQELRSHLTNEHQLTEKSEIKHTTLYACELCADVMHVIKKSFICSTCNYTFSKKEQYDRHMEKHLIGGSMTFKFRGVTRPTTSGKEVKEKIKESQENECRPPTKKPKLSNYSDIPTDVPDASEATPYPKLSPGVFTDKESGESPENKHENSVKIEEMLLEAPELFAEGKEEPITFNAELCSMSPVPFELNIPGKRDDETDQQIFPILNDPTAFSSSIYESKILTFPFNDDHNSKVIEEDTKVQEKQIGVVEIEEQTDIQTLHGKADNDVSNLMLKEPEELYTFNKIMESSLDTSKEPQCLLPDVPEEPKEYTQKSLSPDVPQHAETNTLKDKSLVTEIHALVKDQKFTKKNKPINQIHNISPTQTNVSASTADNVSKSSTQKFKSASCQDGNTNTFKETTSSQPKLNKKEPTVILSKNNTDFRMVDKMLASTAPKQNPKRCKEQKLSGHKSNVGSQENLDCEIKKKRAKLVIAGKNESSAVSKKTDWVNNLSDTKDEAPCNRTNQKGNSGGVTSQLKKTMLDTYNLKKINAASSNGEYKNKRALTKSQYTFTPKNSTMSMNGPPHKRRLGANTKPTEPPNYRTAESQNNLLSQLFGQKITSFKIPLRRDISE